MDSPRQLLSDRLLHFESGPDLTPVPTSGGPREARYKTMGLWLLYILTGYIWARLLALAGLPYDGSTVFDIYEIGDDLFKLLQFGFVLGWFSETDVPSRSAWLFSRWYIHVAYFSTISIYSAVSNLPELRQSLNTIAVWGPEMWLIVIMAAAAAIAAVSFHVWWGMTQLSPRGFAYYLMSRGLIMCVFAGAAVAMKHSSHSYVHLHHYLIAWMLALFGEFNHPISGVTLAVCTAVFVQGVGAYSFAPMFQDPYCFHTQPELMLNCTFTADDPFRLHVCPMPESPVPKATCYTPS